MIQIKLMCLQYHGHHVSSLLIFFVFTSLHSIDGSIDSTKIKAPTIANWAVVDLIPIINLQPQQSWKESPTSYQIETGKGKNKCGRTNGSWTEHRCEEGHNLTLSNNYTCKLLHISDFKVVTRKMKVRARAAWNNGAETNYSEWFCLKEAISIILTTTLSAPITSVVSTTETSIDFTTEIENLEKICIVFEALQLSYFLLEMKENDARGGCDENFVSTINQTLKFDSDISQDNSRHKKKKTSTVSCEDILSSRVEKWSVDNLKPHTRYCMWGDYKGNYEFHSFTSRMEHIIVATKAAEENRGFGLYILFLPITLIGVLIYIVVRFWKSLADFQRDMKQRSVDETGGYRTMSQTLTENELLKLYSKTDDEPEADMLERNYSSNSSVTQELEEEEDDLPASSYVTTYTSNHSCEQEKEATSNNTMNLILSPTVTYSSVGNPELDSSSLFPTVLPLVIQTDVEHTDDVAVVGEVNENFITTSDGYHQKDTLL